MPSSETGLDQVSGTALSPSWKYRGKNWTNTTNFSNVPKVDLPVNHYVDGRHTGFQVPWTYSKTSLTTGITDVIYTGVLWIYNADVVTRHNFMQEEFFPYSSWNTQRDDALLKALVKVSDQKINIAVALAEAHKTSDLILSTANRIYRAYRAFRRGNFKEVAKQLNINPRTIHNSWLEYKYGWVPLLYDVKGAAEFFAQKSLPQRQFIDAIATVKNTRKGVINSGGIYYDRFWPITETWEGTVKTKVKLRVELTSPHAAAAQQLGITNPALVVWELVPYSFVFDWFISVGDWLVAQTALVGVTVKTAMVSHEETTFYSWSQPPLDPIEGSSYVHHYGKREAVDSRRQYWREPLSVDPSSLAPTMNFGNLGFQKIITSCALLRARASR